MSNSREFPEIPFPSYGIPNDESALAGYGDNDDDDNDDSHKNFSTRELNFI